MKLAGFLLGWKGKITALVAVTAVVFYGGWLIRGWYEANIQKSLLEQQRAAFVEEIARVKEQHRRDAEAALATARKLQSLRQKYDALQRGVRDVEVSSSECRVADPAALERLWNDAIPTHRHPGSTD